MRLLPLLSLAALTLLPAGIVDAALLSARPDLAFPQKLVTKLHAPSSSAQAAGKKKSLQRALQVAKPAQPFAVPKPFVLPPAAQIVPNGILSANGPPRTIVSSGAPITPNGILSIPNAAPAVYLQPVNPATREAEIAQLELTQFLYYDYPLQLREFDSQIAVTQAEIAAIQQRLTNYSRFDKFINSANPLFESQQRVNVALVEAQKRLSNLQYERGRIQQWLPVEIRRRQLELHRALTPPTPAPATKALVPYDATIDDDQER